MKPFTIAVIHTTSSQQATNSFAVQSLPRRCGCWAVIIVVYPLSGGWLPALPIGYSVPVGADDCVLIPCLPGRCDWGENQIAVIVDVKRIPVTAPAAGGIYTNKPANLQVVFYLIVDWICIAARLSLIRSFMWRIAVFFLGKAKNETVAVRFIRKIVMNTRLSQRACWRENVLKVSRG